ncbi:MAG: response regulator transcription factor [Pyrinomonadaceae bacterium]
MPVHKSRILIVEDEEHLAEGLKFNLVEEGYEIDLASDGQIAIEHLDEKDYNVVVLDVMLPKVDGFEVARRMRACGDYTPVLMLTARGRPEDVLEGFDAGADDYLTKPFELSIFLARVRSLLRRSDWMRKSPDISHEVANIAGRTIDFTNLELKYGDETVPLTLMEAKLLRHLIERPGTAVSRKEILEDVWGLSEDTDTRAIDNFIVRLRRHLEDEPSNPQILKTVRGVGYMFLG